MELRNFASGDTDYIAKLNSNNSEIQAAIDALQAAAGAAGAGTALSAGLFISSLCNGEDCLIGPGSYTLTQNPTSVTVSPGSIFLAGSQAVVQSLLTPTLNFLGQTAGTKYIVVDAAGTPAIRSTADAGAIYSVFWTGSGFLGEPVRIASVLSDADEDTAARLSTALGDLESPPNDKPFDTLDDRLEAIELVATQAKALAGGTRKIGATVDGSTGVKGAIQIDFAGTIIGWSIIADQPGDITVTVSRASSSPPDDAPAIPDPVADKISASAPIQLVGAQSASGNESDVSTWDPDLLPWDVVQFAVTAATTLTSATLYLRIAPL